MPDMVGRRGRLPRRAPAHTCVPEFPAPSPDVVRHLLPPMRPTAGAGNGFSNMSCHGGRPHRPRRPPVTSVSFPASALTQPAARRHRPFPSVGVRSPHPNCRRHPVPHRGRELELLASSRPRPRGCSPRRPQLPSCSPRPALPCTPSPTTSRHRRRLRAPGAVEKKNDGSIDPIRF